MYKLYKIIPDNITAKRSFMKSLIIRILALFISALPISSCTSIIFVSKTVPPEIEIEGQANLIVVQNYFDYTRAEFVKDKEQEVYYSAVTAFIDGLSSYLEGDELITCITGDTLVKSESGRLPSDFLNQDSVIAICDRYSANLMLSIDSISIGLDWETETVEDDESSYKVKTFYLEVQPFLSLYDNNGSLIDRSYVYRQEFYKDRMALSGLITFKPTLAKAVEEVYAISADAGIGYGSKFFQSEGRSEYKVYYTNPFHVSYLLMLDKKWADAIRDLLPLASSSNKKIAMRAANNLYVAYLGIGDETSADIWYERATGKQRWEN